MKVCSVCKFSRELSSYYRFKHSRDGHSYRCKFCDDAARRKYKENNYERALASQRNRTLKFKYDITTEDFNRLLEAQNFSCKICGLHQDLNKGPGAKNGSQRLCVDHNHETGNIRGLLCNTCNRALGFFEDNPLYLQRAVEYLEKYRIHEEKL